MDPVASLSLAQEGLRVMLGDCATFRGLCGADDREEALSHLHHEGLPAPAEGSEHSKQELEAYRPYGVIYTDERNGFKRRRASTGSFASSGRLKLRLYRSCPEAYEDEPTSDANLDWKNLIGQIVAELCALAIAGGPEHLAFDDIAVDFGPYWSGPELAVTQGVWQAVELGIGWGGQ